MPTRPAVANVLRHTLLFDHRGEWHNNVLHTLHDGAITQARVDADQAALDGWLATHWREVAETTARAVEVRTADLSTSPPTRYKRLRVNYPAGRVGLRIPGDKLPLAATLAVSLRTGAVGDFPKPPHGRLYHVGGAMGPLTDGDVSTEVAAFQTRYDALLAALAGADPVGLLVVVSYWANGSREVPQLRPAPLVLPVTRAYIAGRVDTQRRRMPRQASFTQN